MKPTKNAMPNNIEEDYINDVPLEELQNKESIDDISDRDQISSSYETLMEAIVEESEKFQEYYLWLEKNMPASFFKNVDKENIMLIAHSLMGFNLQNYFSEINLPHAAIVICCDDPDSDLKILKDYRQYGIKNYRTFVSLNPLDIAGVDKHLRIGILHFTEARSEGREQYPLELKEELKRRVKERNPSVDDAEIDALIKGINSRFLKSLRPSRLVLALDMFFRAKTSDMCQCEVRYNEDWKEKDLPSMQIMFAWKNTPKYNFLYRLAHIINRHNLVIQRTNATYVSSNGDDTILVMGIALHGRDNKAAWDVADITDFLREFVTAKFFPDDDSIDSVFVASGLISGNMGNALRIMHTFVHQALVHVDANLYTYANVEEALCRHTELTTLLLECFALKFDPATVNATAFVKKREEVLSLIEDLDSGQAINDVRRKNVLKMAMSFISNTLKTNFYLSNKSAISFRVDPHYLDDIPFDRASKFPELPYGIFFVKGMHFFGFQIRFKDLSRGGLRTVLPQRQEQMLVERDNIFTECYNLAYTQHKKNKDIPEGGSKGIIFLKPFKQLDLEEKILKGELRAAHISNEEVEKSLSAFHSKQKLEYLYHAQRSFIESFLSIINCDDSEALRADNIIDYWKRPEYIYLGPDENMHNNVIEWIAATSKAVEYKPGGSFISSKPSVGINHKEYGVTSLGVNTYMHEVLKYMDIDPEVETFTVKISGGPDGDVAGNQIYNLYKYYRDTAKLIALTDGSGTIKDEGGLDLEVLVGLFKEGKPINCYPPEKLSDGGFLLDKNTTRDESSFVKQTLCWKKKGGNVVEDWLSGSAMNSLYRNNVHSIYADVFIPAGGRPRTLDATNYKAFLDKDGKPTARAIIEGANLYLTPEARRELEKLGTIIIKDSSANKGGVICSSFEVLCGLALGEELFMKNKKALVAEILEILKGVACDEALLMLDIYKKSDMFLTDISDKISANINMYTYQILDYLEKIPLSKDPKDPFVKCFLNYCPKTLQKKFQKQLLDEIPDAHKKAIIACRIGSRIVYEWGLDWAPSIVDVLPIVCRNEDII